MWGSSEWNPAILDLTKVTELESRVLDLVIEWRDSKYAVEEALIRQELIRTIDKLKKERRDAKVEEAKKVKGNEW